jgi:hypothetical protein
MSWISSTETVWPCVASHGRDILGRVDDLALGQTLLLGHFACSLPLIAFSIFEISKETSDPLRLIIFISALLDGCRQRLARRPFA